jgi:hypothetical protein
LYTPAQPKQSKGLLISTIALAVVLAIGLAVWFLTVSNLKSANKVLREDKAGLTSILAEARADLEASDAANEDLQGDLGQAREEADVCREAASLLAKGATGYARLYNRILGLANRFFSVYDTTLYIALNHDEVSNSRLNAAWRALDDCRSTGSGASLL